MAYRIIDMENHPRRAHFAHFCAHAYPHVGVTQPVDVTALVRLCRAQGLSFHLTFVHAAALAADSVPELRQRIRGESVVQYDRCPTSHTEPLPDGTYCYCTLRHDLPFADYIRYAADAREQARQRGSIEEDADVESMYFISALPWLHYTALIQPVMDARDANPRITWGRYAPDAAGRLMLPVTLLAHHALVDGLHLARFFEALDREVARIAALP